jgi:hypothetical protein
VTCWCGRPLIERPGDIEPTCAECRYLPDFCECDRLEDSAAPRAAELRAALLDSAALDSIPPPSPVIDGFLYRDSLAWLHGKPGNGKSFVALDWAGHVAAGLPWHEHEAIQGPVLYLAAEGTSGLRQRVRAWEDSTGWRMGALFLPVAVQVLMPAEREALAEVAAELRPALVVLDTQARVTAGFDENSAKDMGLFVAAADRIRAASGACVLTVHHEARSGDNMRGSTALEGAATSIMRAVKDGDVITVSTAKQKDAPEEDDVRLRLVPRLGSAVLMSGMSNENFGVPTASEREVLKVLRENFVGISATTTKVTEISKLSPATVYRALSSLVRRGEIVNVGTHSRARYAVAGTELLNFSPTSHGPDENFSSSHHPFRGENLMRSPDENSAVWPEDSGGQVANS